MKLNLRFLIWALFDGLLVHCEHLIVATDERFEAGKCWHNSFDLGKAINRVVCKPRDVLIELTPEDASIILYPQKVEVKRCEGVCYGFSTCYPTEKRDIPIPILKHNFMTKARSCGILYLEEHTKCNCGCITKPEDCSERQEYIEDQCRCVCKAENVRSCSQPNVIWNSQTCSCECIHQDIHCSADMEWVPSLCRCAKIVEDHEN